MKRRQIMSTEQIKEFFNKAKADSKLQEQIAAFQAEISQDEQGIPGEQLREALIEKMVALADSVGFTFSIDDLKDAIQAKEAEIAENGELSDDDLESVAGGGIGGMIAVSFVTAGIACGAVSIIDAALGGNCIDALVDI